MRFTKNRNLKTARKNKGLSQQQLADAVGINVKTLIRIEKHGFLANSDTGEKIAEALGCVFDDIFGYDLNDTMGTVQVEHNSHELSFAAQGRMATKLLESLDGVELSEREKHEIRMLRWLGEHFPEIRDKAFLETTKFHGTGLSLAEEELKNEALNDLSEKQD